MRFKIQYTLKNGECFFAPTPEFHTDCANAGFLVCHAMNTAMPSSSESLKHALQTTLDGQYVTLQPIEPAHFDPLYAIASAHPEIYHYSNLAQSAEVFATWFEQALRDQAFVVLQRSDQRVLGSSRFYNINPLVPHASIGYTWYHPDARGTQVNPEAKLLLLTHAFEHMNLARVGFEVDSDNLRSRNAVLKLGATHEGVLRHHRYRYSDQQLSDTYTFSILRAEWPMVKAGLLARLSSASL